MHIGTPDADTPHVGTQLFCHALGERGHKGALVAFDAELDFLQQVVDLTARWTNCNLRVEQACRADNLLGDDTFALTQFVVGWCGADIYRLPCEGFKFLETERTVVGGSLQTETVVHKVDFTALVAAKHSPDLWHRHMALVDDGEEVAGHTVEQTERTLAGFSAVEVARIVLNARAVAHLANHFKVVFHTLFQSLGLHRACLAVESINLIAQVDVDLPKNLTKVRLFSHKHIGRENLELVHCFASGELGGLVQFVDAFDFIAPENHTQNNFLASHKHIYGVALHSEIAHLRFHLVA